MPKYPDNVIPFPGTPAPVSAREVANRDTKEIPPETRDKMFTRITPEKPQELGYLSYDEMKSLDFPLMSRPEVLEEGVTIDHMLSLLADDIGSLAAKSLGAALGKYIASVADMAYAEGLAEAITD